MVTLKLAIRIILKITIVVTLIFFEKKGFNSDKIKLYENASFSVIFTIVIDNQNIKPR